MTKELTKPSLPVLTRWEVTVMERVGRLEVSPQEEGVSPMLTLVGLWPAQPQTLVVIEAWLPQATEGLPGHAQGA